MRLLKSVFSTSTSSRIACGDTEQLCRGLTETKTQIRNHQRNLPDFLSSSGSGTGYTEPHEVEELVE